MPSSSIDSLDFVPVPLACELVDTVLVASTIASQWIAFDVIEVAVAITLMQVSTPVVILLAPLVLGSQMEKITSGLILGTMLAMTGSIAVVLA